MLGTSVPDWDALLQRFREGADRPVLLDAERADRIAARESTSVRAALAEADRYLSGERSYFGYQTVNVGQAVDWSYDPITDYRWPAVASRRLDHQMSGSDPKWIWELNRLQHLPLLAEAWLFTGKTQYATTAFEHLDSWLDQNCIDTGMMWRHPFEVGLRAISVAIALQGLRMSPELTPERYRRVVEMLDASARCCWHARSRFSSANNHLIGELTALLTIHLLIPELIAPALLFQRAVDSLSAAAQDLILADGAGAEQSISYQMFTAELFSIVVVLMDLRGDRAPAGLRAALDRSAQYLVSVVGSDDPDPRYGDDDDGFALRLGAEPKRTVRQHLGIMAVTNADHAAARYGERTLMAAWIGCAVNTSVTGFGEGVGRGEFTEGCYAPNGGLVVLRPGPHRLVMDVGPLGYRSIAAHGHADALAVTLSAEGHELIVDPGTASYCMRSAWRTVHRGTRAHPTVCVDGADQSVMGGPFYWRRHAAVFVRSVDLVRGIVDAEHHGYCRLDDPVVHRRWLIAPPGDATALVVDLLDGRATHDLAVSWPLHPEMDLMSTVDGHLVSGRDLPVLQLSYAATCSIEIEQIRADAESGLGWWSDRLEARTPAWLATARAWAPLPVAVLTVLRTVDAGAIAVPDIAWNDRLLEMSWSEYGVQRQMTIDTSRPGAVVSMAPSSPSRMVSEL